MNLDELQSIRDRERQSDSLQQLRERFYADVGELLEQLRDEREAAADAADDPFDAPEVNRLTDDINTAEQTVEAIYERRVGKLVKMASFAAADMPTEDDGLTAEERELFEQLVAAIEQNRDRVFAVLDGDDPATAGESSPAEAVGTPGEPAPDPTPTPDSPRADADGVDAADLMGGGADEPAGAPDADAASPSGEGSPRPPDEASATADADSESGDPDATDSEGRAVPPDASLSSEGDAPSTESAAPAATEGTEAPADETAASTAADGPASGPETDPGTDVERTTVRITRDVGEILGVDEREYDLSSEDVVTLPAANADPLVERDAAERID
ncbi:MAG: hypothetical protein ABEJ31_10260 [Haloarculaceae archaeon]